MLFGHEDKIAAFKKIINEERLRHAYLFYGDAQIGKFSFAKLLGYLLEFGKFEIMKEPLVDTQVFFPDERGTIGIDSVREIKSFLWQTPFRSPKRLAIIDDSQALTPQAQSAMLKIVEEPPKSSVIIFIAANLQILFPPLLSRLAKVYFKRFPEAEIQAILTAHYKLPAAKAKMIAQKSFGRIGRALDILNEKVENSLSDNDLEGKIENQILDLRKKDVLQNAGAILWLLEREEAVKRYNVNKNLQKKAIQNKIYSNE